MPTSYLKTRGIQLLAAGKQMDPNFQAVIDTISSSDFKSVNAKHAAFGVCNELYHLQRAIKKYGIERVLQEATRILSERYGYTFLEAHSEASSRIYSLLNLYDEAKTFSEVHSSLRCPDLSNFGEVKDFIPSTVRSPPSEYLPEFGNVIIQGDSVRIVHDLSDRD